MEEPKRENLYRVIMVPYIEPHKAMTVSEMTSMEEANLRAKKLRDDRWNEGIVIIQKPDNNIIHTSSKFILEGGHELPLMPFEGKLNILRFPNKNLKMISKKLKKREAQSKEMHKLISSMLLTMYLSPGIGLAAPQVGVFYRMCVMDTQWASTGRIQPFVIFNPEIIDKEGEQNEPEGCLSVPGGVHYNTKRATDVVVKGKDINWEDITLAAYGLEAACFQHEIDHMDGKLFIDYLSRLKRDMYTRKLNKVKRHAKKQAKLYVANMTKREADPN